MNRRPLILVIRFLAAVLLVSESKALVVNLDIEADAGYTFSGQGAYGDVGNNFWNSSLDGMTDLVASDGVTPTPIDVTLSTDSRHNAIGGTIPAGASHSELMGDYAYSRNADTTIAISGLIPNGTYLLYIYGQGDVLNQNATVSFGGSAVSTTGLIDGTIAEGGNYAVISATAGASGEIIGTIARKDSIFAAVNGLQIIYIGQSAGSDLSGVMNVDLGGNTIGTPGDEDNGTGTPFSGQGAYADPGNDYWNNTITSADRTLSNLIASDGSTVTSVDVAVYGGGGFEDTGKKNYLLSDYLYGTITVAISDLNPGGSYTVYVYACGDKSGQGSDVTINNVTKSTSNADDPDAYSQGVNYVVFETTADTLGRLVIYSDEKLNGFQLIEGDLALTGYEAEEAVYSGLAVLHTEEASNHQCLENFDTTGDYVEYQNVEAGNTLSIRYSNGGSSTRCSVYVNEVDVATATFANTGGWSNFVATTIVDIDIPTNAAVKLQIDADDQAYNNNLPCAYQDKIDIEMEGGVIVVDSILGLLEQLGKNNVNVKMLPGEYNLNESDKASGLLPIPTFFEFSGSNCTYDFTGVTLNVHTDLFDEYGAVEIIICTVTGNSNHLFGLTQKDIGDELLSKNVLNFRVQGDDNKIEEVSVYTRSSFPYGYGDLFGKGSGPVIAHRKHSAMLVNGARNHILNCFIDMKTYGHGFFIQGGIDTLVEGVHLVGETRTTDDVLAEEGTGSPADNVDFMTVDGWRVPPGYTFSLQEDGIRCYNTGTLLDGSSRNTANTTVKNCTIEKLRSGVTIGFSDGNNYISGCTAIGVEGSFWSGDGDSVEHCQADAAYAAVINHPYQNDDHQTYELTLLRETEVYGNEQLMYVAGDNHDITLLNSGIQPRPSSQISQLGGMKVGMRYVDFVEGRNGYSLRDTKLTNWTDQPVVLETNSSSCTVASYGAVTDRGTGNTSSSISAVTLSASASTATMGNTVDADAGTSWSADGKGQWIQYDLGMARNLYSVSIQWMSGATRRYFFDIQTSNGATGPWTIVFSGTSRGAASGFEEVCFKTQHARYIRITGRGNTEDDTIEIADVEVDLKDRFAMVKSKSDAGAGYVAQNTLDGDLNTRWAAEGDGQWIQYDLLNTKMINGVSLAWHNGNSLSYSFEIMTSDHPMGPWTTVYSGTSSGTTLELEAYEFSTVSARFIRVTGHGNSQDAWNNLTEVLLDVGHIVSSDPINPEALVIDSVTIGRGNGNSEPGDPSISFAVPVSGEGHDYLVKATDNLINPDWQVISGVLPGNGGELAFDLPVNAAQTNRFYKVEAWRQ
ncbi:discoidin domain-containing protein [Pontiellaceae bacterium B12219]|nr:discoidin domain-containing protein [Pontiellaceae bacterium B12219]